jgi:predicted transcriptional regulator
VDYLAPLRSEIKLAVIAELLEGDKRLAELAQKIDTRQTTISHILKEFETLAFIKKSGGLYSLTPLGQIEAKICKATLAGTRVVKKYKDFWLTHDVSGLPDQSISAIGALDDSVIVTSADVDLQKVHKTFINDVLSMSTNIKGISPIFHPDYIEVLKKVLKSGGQIDLIVNSEVLQKALMSNDAAEIQPYIADQKLRVYLNEDLKFSLTVTENCISLGLFNLSGMYDYLSDLQCKTSEGIEWGKNLFYKIYAESPRILEDF